MASGDQANTSRKKPSGKKAKELSQKEQSERFIKTARELNIDKNGAAFDEAAAILLPPKSS